LGFAPRCALHHAAPENLSFFEPAGSTLPAALKEKT
jgi:hypothetical protein